MGRMQAKRECAYFVSVVHQLRCLVVAVRGTETPEDLLTDGLGRECVLLESDLHGLLQSDNISESLKQHLQSTEPHFGHKGIIEAARELALQLDSITENEIDSGSSISDNNGLSISIDSKVNLAKQRGLLSSLLGPGGECEGYALRFVGHSLGGSIAALTAIKLYARYPKLHVYGYGVLPCLDMITADACSSFVTSIVYNDEFSSRLSVASVKRLRMSAVRALASESSSDSGTISRLARQLVGTDQSSDRISSTRVNDLEFTKEVMVTGGKNRHKRRRYKFGLKGGVYLCSHVWCCVMRMSSHSSERPLNFELRGFTQEDPHASQCHFFLGGTHKTGTESSLEVLPCARRVILEASSELIADQVSDGQNVCFDAGRDSLFGGTPEESEDLVITETGRHGQFSETLQATPEVVCEPHHLFASDAYEVHESMQQVNSIDGVDSVYDVQKNLEACLEANEKSYSEMFMPGLIIHLVPANGENLPLWQGWRKRGQQRCQHRAFIKERKSFQDIVVSPSMFLDHMPWRCQYALNSVLEHIKSTTQVTHEWTDVI